MKWVSQGFTVFIGSQQANKSIGLTETYLEPCQTSTMKLLYENSYRLLAINYFRKKVHHRCLINVLVH